MRFDVEVGGRSVVARARGVKPSDGPAQVDDGLIPEDVS